MSASTTNDFKLPPMRYDLLMVNSLSSLYHIRELCNQAGTTDNFILALNEVLLQRNRENKPTIFGYLIASTSDAVTKQVIGGNGYYFKHTTTTTGVDFIWHDRDNKVFLFWAPNKSCIVKAINAIRWRINKYTILDGENLNIIHIPTANVDADEEDYSDMPDLIDCDGNICNEYDSNTHCRTNSISVGCVPDMELSGLPD